MNIRPNSEGVFYPKSSKALLRLFDSYDHEIKTKNSRLIIVPHAGYEFSGELTFKTYQYFKNDLKEIVIFAPAIYNKLYGIITSNAENFSTPLGEVKIKAYNYKIDNKICRKEPPLGIQIPFIKYFYPDSEVVPVIYGCEDFNNLSEIIKEKYFENAGIVIVTNLSRFVPARQALKLDNQTSRMIEKLQIQDLDSELADGAAGICAAIKFAKEHNFHFIPTGHNISSDVNDDTSCVVGYGGWYMTTR